MDMQSLLMLHRRRPRGLFCFLRWTCIQLFLKLYRFFYWISLYYKYFSITWCIFYIFVMKLFLVSKRKRERIYVSLSFQTLSLLCTEKEVTLSSPKADTVCFHSKLANRLQIIEAVILICHTLCLSLSISMFISISINNPIKKISKWVFMAKRKFLRKFH